MARWRAQMAGVMSFRRTRKRSSLARFSKYPFHGALLVVQQSLRRAVPKVLCLDRSVQPTHRNGFGVQMLRLAGQRLVPQAFQGYLPLDRWRDPGIYLIAHALQATL